MRLQGLGAAVIVVGAIFAWATDATAQTEGQTHSEYYDRWETVGADANSNTTNLLVHGMTQLHTLWYGFSGGDEDWARVATEPRHSYLLRISASTYLLNNGGFPFRVDRVTDTGVPLTTAVYTDSRMASLKFEGSGSTELLRVFGPTGANRHYTLEFFDTTLFAPRFNNSSSQVTVMILQNTTGSVVNAKAHFYDAAGSLLLTHSFSVPGSGGFVLNTATVLGGQSGSIAISHDGDWEALKGKLVAVEATTGFTFDTLFEAKRR